MPLESRVSPFGELFAASARGTMMGNRGGRLHDERKKLSGRGWSSKQWICCKLEFNNRRRAVWGNSYTELFFLDEVTALTAGHRPCFECRRKEAERFALLFAGKTKRASAPAMDAILHAERLVGTAKRAHVRKLDTLPDGAMVAIADQAYAVRGRRLLQWTPEGYGDFIQRRRGVGADVLTPPSILAVLKRGYAPRWHMSAN